jgi:hypothetical protein
VSIDFAIRVGIAAAIVLITIYGFFFTEIIEYEGHTLWDYIVAFVTRRPLI